MQEAAPIKKGISATRIISIKMEFKGLKLDRFQEDAIKAIENNHSVVVSAPTGSGKTLIADYIINRDMQKGIGVIYTAPIKALSNQKYKEFCDSYGQEKVGLLTGDVSINPNAMVVIMTTEVYRNMVITKEILDEGVLGFVQKPFGISVLSKTISETLNIR